ncbi:MerR family transcriptional regulator, partial [Staphylococcus aureus]
MAITEPEKDYLTTSQAARLLAVSPDTVLKWVRAGKVKSYRTLGGHFRIPLSEIGAVGSGAEAKAEWSAVASPVRHQYC